ncbi:MAG: hypothetical protein WC538_21990 [Thermoanaerobaculia bacterium]|jgi:hypothetical protein
MKRVTAILTTITTLEGRTIPQFDVLDAGNATLSEAVRRAGFLNGEIVCIVSEAELKKLLDRQTLPVSAYARKDGGAQ